MPKPQKRMHVKDTFKNFCELCWPAFVVCSLAPLLFGVVTVVSVFSGVWSTFWIFGSITLGLIVFIGFVGYMEANSHWKAAREL